MIRMVLRFEFLSIILLCVLCTFSISFAGGNNSSGWLNLGKELGCSANISDLKMSEARRIIQKNVQAVHFNTEKADVIDGRRSLYIVNGATRYFIGLTTDANKELKSLLYVFQDGDFNQIVRTLEKDYKVVNKSDGYVVLVNDKNNPVVATDYKRIVFVECAERNFAKLRGQKKSVGNNWIN